LHASIEPILVNTQTCDSLIASLTTI
jgi:hypothetical protein